VAFADPGVIVAMKVVHVSGLAVWCGGLLLLPAALALRNGVGPGRELDSLHRLVRAAYVGIVSPAALAAIASGLTLIFLREVYDVWMQAKLAVVTLLVMLHLWTGRIVQSVFRPGRRFGLVRNLSLTGGVAGAIMGILWLVLGKPMLGLEFLPAWMRRPGGLQSLLETMMPTP
jgi:putative membrane protein